MKGCWKRFGSSKRSSVSKRSSWRLQKSLAVAGLDLATKRAIVAAMAPIYGVRRMCLMVQLPLSTWYYQPTGRIDAQADAQLVQALKQIAGRHITYGYRRLLWHVKQHRAFKHVGKTRVQRVAKAAGIQAHKPARRVYTTQSRHGFRRYPNLVLQRTAVRPDELWVCDITYVVLASGEIVYLAIIMDVFTRCIRGWDLSRDLTHVMTLGALRRALRRAVPEVHHSDQGVQPVARMGYMPRPNTPAGWKRVVSKSAKWPAEGPWPRSDKAGKMDSLSDASGHSRRKKSM
jgi:hypothetical protein